MTVLRIIFFMALQTGAIIDAGAQMQTTLSCRLHHYAGSAVSLYQLKDGQAQSLGFRRPDNGDTCSFSIPMEKEGIYFIQRTSPHPSSFNYVIYLKPGENKLVDLYYGKISLDFDSCIISKPNPETLALQKWATVFNKMVRLGVNRMMRDSFISNYDSFVREAEVLKKKSHVQNKYFNYLLDSKIDADCRFLKAAAFFNYGERMNAGYDTVVRHRSFYLSLSGEKFCDADILHSEHGLDLVKYTQAYHYFFIHPSEKSALPVPFADKARIICNKEVRRSLVEDRMMSVTNYEEFKKEILPFRELFESVESKIGYQKKEDQLTVYAKGAKAYDFSLTDVKNKTVQLSDFKGKVVVLDIWAMWCAPCLAEKPFFQKLEEEYKQREDIVFVGISVDGINRKDVWKNFVEKKGWTNLELISNHDESVMKYYKIEGIPRLMIFDREGKIVTVDAPRPSSSELKKLIEQTLNDASSHP